MIDPQISASEAAIEILRATNDGDLLSPIDLSLLQSAVNGWLTEAGETAFYQLLERTRTGYRAQWFHGIEHLTIDHEGYIYWKSSQVEHYTPSWAYSEEAHNNAKELAERCRHLEATNVPVNTTNAIWHWEKHSKTANQ